MEPLQFGKVESFLDKDMMFYSRNEAQEGGSNQENPFDMHGGNQKGPPSLSTLTGAKILDLVANATEPLPLVLRVDYIYDGGCEYAYLINLGTNELKVKGGCT